MTYKYACGFVGSASEHKNCPLGRLCRPIKVFPDSDESLLKIVERGDKAAEKVWMKGAKKGDIMRII